MTISEQLIDVTFGEVELVCWHRAHIFYKTTGISRTNSARHPSVKLLNRPGQSCISHTRTQTHKNTQIQIHTHAHTYASTQTHTRKHARMHSRTHAHTHTHTLTHTHLTHILNTQNLSCRSSLEAQSSASPGIIMQPVSYVEISSKCREAQESILKHKALCVKAGQNHMRKRYSTTPFGASKAWPIRAKMYS